VSWKPTPIACRGRLVLAGGFVALLLSVSGARGSVPDYKLGDVASEDVVTPVQLLVVNPEATGALKQRVAEQVLLVVRHSSQSAAEAEADLRQSIAAARGIFLGSLQAALEGRTPTAAEIDRVSASSLAEMGREVPKDFPLEQLARIWMRGESDERFVESLLQPMREVMMQPVLNSRTDATFPANQLVRLMAVKSLNEPPTAQEIEDLGQVISPGKIISLWRARRLVETHFPAGQEQSGRFAATFVRPNAVADLSLTEILRARRMEGVTVNETYEPAQVIVRKGQVIDRKALSALAVMREKSLIGALQTKLEQEHVVAGQITHQTKWIAAILGAMCLALILIWRRLRVRPSTALVLGQAPAFEVWEATALPAGATEGDWQQRALLAEKKVERAHEAIRTGVLGWMREKVFRTLFRHRGELLSVQRKAEAEMRELEQRLEQLHTPLQERISSYEKRIEELENDLAVKGEENRQLIGARITVAKQQLMAARQRGRFGSN
jgi:7TM-HD extracellular